MTSRQDLKQASFTYDGRRYWVYGHTAKEAKEKAKVKKALLEAGVRDVRKVVTVSRWCDEWLKAYKVGTVGDAWYDQIHGIVDNYIVPAIGMKAVKDVKPIDITKMLNDCANLSESYLRKILQVTRQVFESAEENDLTLRDPARHVGLPKGRPKEEHRTITPAERDLTLKTANKRLEDGLFFLVMLYCGCRPQEIAVLRMSDITPDKVLHVTKARKADDTVGAPKSKAGIRDIPIPDALFEILMSLDRKPSDLICTNTQGGMITRSSQKTLWTRFKRAMDIENGAKVFRNAIVKTTLADDLVPYCYRHTYCTDLQDAGVPLVVASRLMGHSDIKVTAQIYTHHSQESFEDARSKINAHTRSTTPSTTSE